MNDFRWLIEAPSQHYLAVQHLSMSDNFEWTRDHDRALAFRSEDQADGLMMAVRQMDRERGGLLFAFEATLGNARPVEHGWMNAPIDEAAQDASVERFKQRLTTMMIDAASRINAAR